MLQEFEEIIAYSLSMEELLRNVSVALICGLIISSFYRWSYKGAGYSAGFVNALVALAMITAIVILVIGNNLARAFGLVGAMSIIRFRTAVKDTHDIVFIFFSLAAGMAAGVGYNLAALVGTMFVGSTILILSKINYGKPQRGDYLLQFHFNANGQETPYLPVLEKYCRREKLINVKAMAEGDLLELSYYVHVRDRDKCSELVRELGRVKGVDHVNFYHDDEPI